METEKICRNCDHYCIQKGILGECQKTGSYFETIDGKRAGGDFKFPTYTCSDFKPKSAPKQVWKQTVIQPVNDF